MAADSLSDCCVVCLDNISSPCVARPCDHAYFDFVCLANWLNYNQTCPLCKATVVEVRYEETDAVTQRVHERFYHVPSAENSYHASPPGVRADELAFTPTAPESASLERAVAPATAVEVVEAAASSLDEDSYLPPWVIRSRNQQFRAARVAHPSDQVRRSGARRCRTEAIICRRRHVYRHELYSQHVGSNRFSGWRPLPTPAQLAGRPDQIERARAWVRRELQVFFFLHADPEGEKDRDNNDGEDAGVGRSQVQGWPQQRRAPRSERDVAGNGGRRWMMRPSKAQTVLEMVTAILKSIDLQGSAGAAELMLADFLGRAHARLFLHELRSWLRCPYGTLQEWDSMVQYSEAGARAPRARRRRARSSSCSDWGREGRSQTRGGGGGVEEEDTAGTAGGPYGLVTEEEEEYQAWERKTRRTRPHVTASAGSGRSWQDEKGGDHWRPDPSLLR